MDGVEWDVYVANDAFLEGLGLHALGGADSLRGRVLETEAFPPLFIATAYMDAALIRSQPSKNKADEALPSYYIALNVSEE